MLRPLWSLILVAVLGAAVQAQPPLHKIEITDHQTITATITYEIKTANCLVERWTAFLPEPPELPGQTKLKVTSEPAGKIVAEKSLLARKVRLLDVKVARPAPGANLVLRLDVEATLRSRKLVPLSPTDPPPRVVPLTESEKKYYLAASGLADYDTKPFGEWLDTKKLRRGKTEPPLEFAARVLEVLRADYEYRFDLTADRKASAVCGRKATDCGGMSVLFVAAMRANGVPARLLVGRLAKPRKPGSAPGELEYEQPHARAEFYVAGIGWVPVDPNYANLNRGTPVTEFIGYDPGDLLVLHLDTDLKLPFPDQVRSAELLQVSVPCWATGKGKFDGTLGPTGWELKTTPIEKK